MADQPVAQEAPSTFIANVQMPDGKVHKFEVPTGMKPEDIEQNALDAYMAQGRTESLLNPQANERNIPRTLLQSGIKAVANPIDLVAGFPKNVENATQYAKDIFQGKDVQMPHLSTPFSNALIRKGVLQQQYEPASSAMRIADVATQVAAPGSLLTKGENLLPTVARATGQGLAAGGMNEYTNSIGIQNPMAQAGAAALASGVAGLPFALRHTAANVAHEVTKNVTDADLKAAQNLVTESYKLGSPLTGAEALAKVTGANPLSNVQRLTETLPQSSETMASFMQKRPEANRQMVGNALNQISPSINGAESSLQQNAANVISNAEKMRTQAVEPFYENTKQNFNPAQTDVNALATNPVIGDAINHVLNDPYAGAKGLKPNSPQTLIAAKQYLDAQYDRFSNPMAGSMDKAKAANAYSGSRLLDNYLAEQSPSYGQGRDIYRQVSNEIINPLQEGRIGTLAQKAPNAESQMRAQQNVLMPTNPQATTPTDIKNTVSILRSQNPNAIKDWTKQSLQSVFNEAAQNTQTGPNQAGGAKFASLLRGNSQQADNLRTLITETAGMQAYQGFERVLENLEAQGTRQGAGSQTASNLQMQRQLGEGGRLAAAKLVFKPSEVATKYEEWQLGKNANKLATILTSPDSIDQLKELARTKPTSAKAQTLINSLVGGYVAQKPSMTEENK